MRTIRGAWRSTKETTALVAILSSYWVTVFPVVRRELARWRACASEIPEPGTRALALRTLDEEGGLAEGAAIFATLVPGRAARRDLIRLLVAWQVAYDYLDTVGEELSAGSPIDSADLYAPLGVAVDPAAGYAGHVGDGGYLDGLVARCRASVAALPSAGAVGPFAVRAAERCAEVQSITHATGSTGPEPLRQWALRQAGTDGFLWWEAAAGAISSLGVHALLATAALPRASASEAARIDSAYFPSLCALSTLLDSTIDADDDAGTTNHRCTDYYADADETSGRIVAIAGIAAAAARALPRGRGHAVILAGMTAYYAASSWAGNERTHRRVASAVSIGTGPILWTLRLRGWLRRMRDQPDSSRGSGERINADDDLDGATGVAHAISSPALTGLPLEIGKQVHERIDRRLQRGERFVVEQRAHSRPTRLRALGGAVVRHSLKPIARIGGKRVVMLKRTATRRGSHESNEPERVETTDVIAEAAE